jgi:hypothetical protein
MKTQGRLSVKLIGVNDASVQRVFCETRLQRLLESF